jgi:transposase
MTLRLESIPPIPQATAAAACAIFPDGNVYMTIREELGTIFSDAQFAPWFAQTGRPVELLPWRAALILVLQHMENLTDRQAANAVRRCIDWKYLLALELTDTGFDFTLLHDFRLRILEHAGEQQLLDSLLMALKARGLLCNGTSQRTDATHVLASIRTLNRLECVGEAMRQTLNAFAVAAPSWLQVHMQSEWYERYQARFDDFRLPAEQTKRLSLALTIGQDGISLLQSVFASDSPLWLREIPAVQTLRRIWIQQYLFEQDQLRWREQKDLPPNALLIVSPYDTDARFSGKRDTYWTGYKVHLTETCDPGLPHLITHVQTTAATTHDALATPQIQADLAAQQLTPDVHLADTAYISAEQIDQAQRLYGSELLGPLPPDNSWQARENSGYALANFTIDWQHKQAICPLGKQSVLWCERENEHGQAIIQVGFGKADCAACAERAQCTRAKEGPRTLKLHPQAQYEALQQRRQEQETEEFKRRYAKRAGIEGTISQGVRGFEMRRTPYRGITKTHLHHILLAIAINLTRLVAWLLDDPPFGPYPRQARFAALKGAAP